MTNIMVPSRPSWKVTIVVDQNNQAQIAVEDLNDTSGIVALPGGKVGRVPRQMNQIELALLLTNIVSSTLVNTLNIARKGNDAKPTEKTNYD